MKIATRTIGLAALGAALAFSASAEMTPASDSNLPATGSSTTGAGPANAPANSPSSQSTIRGKEMKKLDKNQDGMVTREEAKADKDWTKLFSELDADGNGMIVASELLVLEERAQATDTITTTKDGEKSDLTTPKK